MLSVLDEAPAESEEPELQILKEEVKAEPDIEGENDCKSDGKENDETVVHTQANGDGGDAEDDKDLIPKPADDDATEADKHDEEQEQEEDEEEDEDEDEEEDEETKRQPDRGEIRSRILKEQYEKFLQMAGGVSAKQKVEGVSEGEAPEAESSPAAEAVPLSAEDIAKLPKFLQAVAKERAIRLKRSENNGYAGVSVNAGVCELCDNVIFPNNLKNRAKKFGIEFKEPDLVTCVALKIDHTTHAHSLALTLTQRTIKNAQLSAAELRRLAGTVLGGKFAGRAFLTKVASVCVCVRARVCVCARAWALLVEKYHPA